MKRSISLVVGALAALVLLVGLRAPAPAAPPDERRDDREREEERARELKALQGTWRFIRYEEDGRSVDDGAKRSWIIRGRRWSHEEQGERSPEYRLQIDTDDNLRELDVWDGVTHVISAIYVRSGDFLILCGNRPADQGKGRPERFETGTREGGLFMIVCRIENDPRRP